jgi:hypothetical protein
MELLQTINENGTLIRYYDNGELSLVKRLNGDTLEYVRGALYRFTNAQGLVAYLDEWGEYHRKGAPAVIMPNGTQMYFSHGQLNRRKEPAVIYTNGEVEYWTNGRRRNDREVESDERSRHKSR